MPKLSFLSALFLFSCCFGFAQKPPAADAIIARYVKMIGGEKQWAAIKTSEFHATATIGDKALIMLIIKAGSGKLYQSMEGGNLSITEIYDSGSAIVLQNGKPRKITDTIMLDHYQLQSNILPDMSYIKLQYNRQVSGLENINGVPCYKVILTSKNGSVNTNYYEQKSGLLTMIEKSGVKTYLSDYKFYKGCSIPFSMSTDSGNGYSMKIKLTEWLINQKSSVELFNTKKQEAGL
ncbi:hypothetical protein [Mucilaginibacter sp.]|jgi:hypothetical protein|uniref:hypothetical protein n=1 Tax=Mucilaginibacter sp. TaxID=1882438 RepID=UPI0035687DFF